MGSDDQEKRFTGMAPSALAIPDVGYSNWPVQDGSTQGIPTPRLVGFRSLWEVSPTAHIPPMRPHVVHEHLWS